jgi:WD40 repeat protein
MGRFFLTVLLAVGVAAGVAYYYELPPFAKDTTPGGGEHPDHPDHKPVQLGKILYTVQAPSLNPIVDRADPDVQKLIGQPIVVPESHLVTIDKQEASSSKDGNISVIGRTVPGKKDNAEIKDKGEVRYIIGEPADKKHPGSIFQPTVSFFVEGEKYDYDYRRLKEGAIVEQGQIVALIDPTKAVNEIASKIAKIRFAKEDYKAAVAMAEEAQARLNRLDDLKRRDPRVVTAEEYSAAVLTRDKHKYEAASKKEQITVQDREYDQAVADYHQHEIRCVMPGKSIVKQIYKNMGDGLKNQEPVLQLHNISRLRAEGAVEAQYFDLLASRFKQARVILEPSQESAPESARKAHFGEINAVAVSRDGNTFVSGSEDRTICVWRRNQVGPPDMLWHSSPVRALACTPPGSKQDLCAAGLADGRIVLWDLSQAGKSGVKPVLEIRDAHRDAVSALAFSPDGKWIASGGQDNMIVLWETGKEKAVYPFDAEHGVDNPHSGTVTALSFTPEGKLVSAARDNTLRVWQLHENGAALESERGGRSGTVANTGVTGTAGDQWMVYDRGRTLQLLSVKDQRTMAVLNNSSAATQFETFVLFSPDGALMLTAGAPEGRMQLWRTPGRFEFRQGNKTEVRDLRGFEVRQLVPTERAAVTCAAFAPNGQFAVSGTKDGYVHVWSLPTRQEVAAHRISTNREKVGDTQAEVPLRLSNLDRALDAGKIRIGVEVQNLEVHNPESPEDSHFRLIPGRRVTVVIEP